MSFMPQNLDMVHRHVCRLAISPIEIAGSAAKKSPERIAGNRDGNGHVCYDFGVLNGVGRWIAGIC